MTPPFLQVLVRSEDEVVLARQRTRRVAVLAGLALHDQTRLAVAVSEVVRLAFQAAGRCTVRFSLAERDGSPMLEVAVAWPPSATPPPRDDPGLVAARRLVDAFSASSTEARGTVVRLARRLPSPVSPEQATAWRDLLLAEAVPSPREELERQNRELIRTLEALREKELALAGQLTKAERLNRELVRTNDELDRTNAGVISLYREIEDKNDVLVREVAERRAVEEQLARSNKDLENFAYIASHDLREPLRMISSFLQLLVAEHGAALDAEAHEYIGFAVDGAARMQELIDDLLTYSRVGRLGKPFGRCDMEEVFQQVVLGLREAIQESGAEVTHDPLPVITADRLQMMQLLQNLVSNAIKFRRSEPPRVHVSGSVRESEVVFSVRDNGIGIEPHFQERVFVIFQRLHTREEYPGTGIGLAVCKRIVDRHGGTIWVESEPDRGSTFRFSLPRDLAPGAVDATP